jgi:predicted XRE-type DNA-binding protein
MKDAVKIDIGSGNVFKDLGFENPEEQIKAELTRQINSIIKKRHWTQKIAASKLGLTQPKISLLNRGRLKNFSLEKLMYILNQLNQDIEIVVKDRKSRANKGIGAIHVIFAN